MTSNQGVLTLAMTVVLLALPSLTYGETLHVRPTSINTSCPMHSCYTLSEYTQDLGQYFNDSNLTLQFLPGNHTLDVNVTVTGIHRMEFLGNSSAVVPTKIVCSPNVGVTFRNVSEVRMDRLDFVLCARSHGAKDSHGSYFRTYYGLYLQSVQTAEIIDCTFQDSYGSALGVVDSHVVLRGNNNFLNNCRLCSNERYGLQGPKCIGGGVFVCGSNLTLSGSSSFIGNSAYNGGGVHVGINSNLNILGNTIFTHNSARYCGGGIYEEFYSNVNLIGNTSFINNFASGDGGGVCVRFSSDINFHVNTTFIGNSASGDGGGVYAWSYSKFNICGSTTFMNNSASDNGGGVSAWFNSNVNISGNTTFVNNSASDDGGGAYARSDSSVNISGNTTFIGNSAKNGGGVSSDSSKVNINGNTTLLGNSVSGDGGGIHAWSFSNVNVFGNANFINNSASDNGGGVSVLYNSNVDISKSTTFIDNKAGKNGGGAHARSAW